MDPWRQDANPCYPDLFPRITSVGSTPLEARAPFARAALAEW
jgi:hypothetical protein